MRRAGRLQAACDSFAEAARRAPLDALYWLNLARSEQLLGRVDEATQHADRAFALDRTSLIACNLLAQLKWDAHRSDEALHVLDQLDADVERDAPWHLLRGAALVDAHRFEAGVHSLLAALAAPGADAGLRKRALINLGPAFAMIKRHRDAALCCRMVQDLDPLALGSALFAAYYSAWACDWAALEQDLARLAECVAAVQAQPPQTVLDPISPFSLIGLSDDPQLLKWFAERNGAKPAAGTGSTAVTPTSKVPRPGGRLRIGLISSDFHHHATSFLLVEVLEAFERERFELVLYSGGPDDGSAMRRRVMSAADRVHEVSQWSDDELTAQVRRDEIGVLIDLKGFTLGSRLGAMATRPAPIQVAWLGYPGTCGAGFIDYIVGDPVVTPLEAQVHYSERIAQMPHCYQPNDSRRSRPAAVSRADCGLPDDAFVFASFNQSYKIMPPVFDAWCRILVAKPGSVLWLLVPDGGTQARLRQTAAGHGIGGERIVFAPFVDIEVHRARLPNADLFLDTFPCGGHTTASDALWAGVPVLTMIGNAFASRVAASLVTTLGLSELVCADLDEYVTQALRYARDAEAFATLRERVEIGRQHSPLFDGPRFARDFEQLLLRMVERRDAGLAPAALPASMTPEEMCR